MERRNVYFVTYDLVINNSVQVDDEPAGEAYVMGLDFEEAYELAQAIRFDLRPSAVYKELAIRSLTLVHPGVVIGPKEAGQ